MLRIDAMPFGEQLTRFRIHQRSLDARSSDINPENFHGVLIAGFVATRAVRMAVFDFVGRGFAR